MADEPIAPPLPSGSVDFDKIHAAARQNHDLEKAIAEATFVHPDKIAADEAAAKEAAAQSASADSNSASNASESAQMAATSTSATTPSKGKSKEA